MVLGNYFHHKHPIYLFVQLDIDLSPNCDREAFGSESWATCNKVAKQFSIFEKIKELYEKTYQLVLPDQTKLIKDIGLANSSILKVERNCQK